MIYLLRASESHSDLAWIADQLRFLSRKIDRIAKIETESERDFRYSPCFRSVQIDQRLFHLTAQQAEVVRTLYANWLQGTPDVSTAYLLETLAEQGFAADRLKDLFQKDKRAFHELVRPGMRRGTVRLNLAANR